MRYTDLFEAAPSRVVASQIYWHGTNNTSGQKVLRDGFIVGSMRPRGATYLAPLLPGIYMTPDPTYALNFAKWDNTQKFGWMFACQGSDMIDVEIDEDEVGTALKSALRKERFPNETANDYQKKFVKAAALALSNDAFRAELLGLAKRLLSEEELINLSSRNHPGETARAGAKLISELAPATKLMMIDHGCHITHMVNLIPSNAWRFSPKLATKINNELVIPGNSPVDVLDRLAERMR